MPSSVQIGCGFGGKGCVLQCLLQQMVQRKGTGLVQRAAVLEKIQTPGQTILMVGSGVKQVPPQVFPRQQNASQVIFKGL